MPSARDQVRAGSDPDPTDWRASVPERSAGVPPAVAGASRPRFGEVTIRDRGRLPHWEKEGATYFITFRLADSLPKAVLDRVRAERESMVRSANQMKRALSADERKKIQLLSTKVIEQYLDQGSSSCSLRTAVIGDLVASTLLHFDDKRYRLFAWCVMPNQVHVVVRTLPGHALDSVVHSWKSFSAKEANKISGTTGRSWQREYYDHLIRNESELSRAMEYVANNPVKAGLRDWKWVWVWGRDAPTTAGGTPALQEPALPRLR